MSPSVTPVPNRKSLYKRPNVFIYGLGSEYPPHNITPEDLDVLARRFYPSSPALEKVLTINSYTGIDSRSSIGNIEHPVVNQSDPPTITELNDIFMTYGVDLSVAAARKALHQSRTPLSEITHVVSTTCTNSANPGYDHFVVKKLGLNQSVQKVLLHGVGCSGGMAALRTAAGLVMGESFRGRKARCLVLATEISTTLVRSELESVAQNQEVRIGLCLFSDCASALVVGNRIGEDEGDEQYVAGNDYSSEGETESSTSIKSTVESGHPPQRPRDRRDQRQTDGENEPVLELLGWEHKIIEDTEQDLGFDVDPLGWKVVLTPRVPSLTSSVVPTIFQQLVSSIPLLKEQSITKPTQFAWALHPGGATILSGVERVMGIQAEEHLRESYETYVSHGNSSSATWGSVLSRMMKKDGRQDEKRRHIVGCAFGPGIAVEMVVLKRLDLEGDEREEKGLLKAKKDETHGTNGVNGHGDTLLNGMQRLDVNGGDSGIGSSQNSDLGVDSSGGGSGSGSTSGAMTPVEILVAEDVD